MRKLNKNEIIKRGCAYCSDVQRRKEQSENGRWERYVKTCPFEECPYHELDKYDTYDEYLEAIGGLSADAEK